MSKKDKNWQNNVFIYTIVGVIILLIGGCISHNLWENKIDKNIEEPKINVEDGNLVVDSPNSVNVAGNNNVVNKLNLPPPEFKATILSRTKTYEEGAYQTTVRLDIISRFPLQRIEVGIIDDNILSIDARKDSVISSMPIMQQMQSGQALVSFENAMGSYLLIIKTKNQDTDLLSKIKIKYQ
ncbi:MAG: hypothetical protein WC531_01735 [Candidatus Paceibacterota bacterium]|jgi:hypothetical protein